MTNSQARIAIIGGGISGLTAAHRLRELLPSAHLTILEAAPRPGGVLCTERRDGFLVERAADMFTSKDPWALHLCRRIGLESELVGANEAGRKAFIVHRGELVEVPQGFVLMRPTQLSAMLTTPLLSPLGKLRLMMEPLKRAKKDESDESLASFVRRRMGQETFERIVQPLVGGIYTADPERLSMAATMPSFVEMERRHGSLIRAPQATRSEKDASGARYGMFVSLREGMQQLVDRLVERIGQDAFVCNAGVQSVQPANDHEDGGRWRVRTMDDEWNVDAVIVTCRAPHAAQLFAELQPALSDQLRAIEYASTAVVVMAVDDDQIGRPVQGFGFVAPLVEQRKILATSFASAKFPGRAPYGKTLVRVFIGGACQSELLEHDDHQLIEIARHELRELIGLAGDPLFAEVVRWNEAMPQYHVGHLDRVAAIERSVASLPGLELAGNAYRGVGIPFCIRSAEQAAENVADVLCASG
ncbi:MAG: protoporphyrinogen oxidase [Pirellulaceae bacterium]|nr:protoporphyrinogen oxidase [Pirellulaceae bacterium]